LGEKLFSGFPPVTTKEWAERISADLKGTGFRDDLFRKTEEDIPVKPFYRREDLEGLKHLELTGSLKPAGREPNSWSICQDIFPGSSSREANTWIRTAIEGGADAIRIHLKDSPPPDRDFIETLFAGVPISETEILFQDYLGADAIYEHLLKMISGRNEDPLNLNGCLGADPLGKMVSTGIPVASMENIGRLTRKVSETSPGMRVIDVNGTLFQNAGSTLAEELAFTLAMASDYLAILTSKDLTAGEAISSLQLSMATGPDYFMEIAKLRAARILWEYICEGYGSEPLSGKVTIHSTSSGWNMTLYDPHANILRGTTEAMSSILGGADLVTVLPFDHHYGNSSVFSDRIARNVQIILREESYFGRVSDPSSGSYYIENLTDSIAGKAWDLFRETESRGGFRKSFESGWIQQQVTASRRKKLEKYASGSKHILGTNAFPRFNEKILDKLSQDHPGEAYEPAVQPLTPFRVASVFEEIRVETERMTERPKVLLFRYGNPAWMTARANFSGNFLACAGYEILDTPAFRTIEEGIKASRKASPHILVLCSSDDSYITMAPPVLESMKDRAIVAVAGYPRDDLDELRKAGIEHFIHVGSHLLNTLRQFNALLKDSITPGIHL
jgi:methylmalonyl-CoA mutase